MQSFILLGSLKNQQEYLDSFQKEHHVPEYLVSRYLEGFKIADARLLQKVLASKLQKREARMVIITDVTQDSQNAILKTLEELPEKTYIFFLCATREDILPTIASRCSFIVLEQEKTMDDKEIEEHVRKAVIGEKNSDNLFALIDSLGATLDDTLVESVIRSLRKVLLTEISQSTKNAALFFICLKKLDKNYKLTKTNNVNKRLALEVSFLRSSPD